MQTTHANGNSEGGRLLTVEQTAVRLGVSVGTVWRWVSTGRLRVVRLGRRCTRVRAVDLESLELSASSPVLETPSEMEITGGAVPSGTTAAGR